MELTAVFILVVFGYSLVSRRFERSVITAPMLFTFAGMAASLAAGGLDHAVSRKSLLLLAELGLVMTLFTDASRVDLRALRRDGQLALRLLSVGMLLSILAGALLAKLVLAELSWWEACILAAILAPTDAGLGQLIFTSTRVPVRIRQTLNVEAGLNDGLAVPFLMCFMAMAIAEEQGASAGRTLSRFALEQLGYGALIGLMIGLAGGGLLGLAQRRQWMAAPFARFAVIALPMAGVLAAEVSGASMFIVAFVGGLAVQAGFPEVGKHSVEFTEDFGQLLNLFVFLLFGALSIGVIARDGHETLLYAVLSLTVIRMVPVALALIGTGLRRETVLFMGWFGPRGLASIVLGLVYLESAASLPGEATIKGAVVYTVLLSVFVHGLTSMLAMSRYANRLSALDERSPEFRPPAG